MILCKARSPVHVLWECLEHKYKGVELRVNKLRVATLTLSLGLLRLVCRKR